MLRLHIPEDKKSYPRVTTILSTTMRISKKEGIAYWRKMLGEDKAAAYLQNAIDRGNKFHEPIDQYFNRYVNDAIPKGVLEFLEKNEMEVILCEASIWSDKYKYRGRTDIVYLRKKLYYGVLDWKTGVKERKPTWFADAKAQVSAYGNAIEEIYNLPITEGMVVVAYQDIAAPFNPFVVNKPTWKFQKCEMNASAMKRAFNRFVKRVGEYYDPPTPKPRKVKKRIELLPAKDPFGVF